MTQISFLGAIYKIKWMQSISHMTISWGIRGASMNTNLYRFSIVSDPKPLKKNPSLNPSRTQHKFIFSCKFCIFFHHQTHTQLWIQHFWEHHHSSIVALYTLHESRSLLPPFDTMSIQNHYGNTSFRFHEPLVSSMPKYTQRIP